MGKRRSGAALQVRFRVFDNMEGKEMSRFEKNGGRLVYRFDGEQVWIEPWGTDALRCAL